jgi:uncharacterized protein
MSSLRFEWDSQKAAVNAKKHGVSFEEAKSVFSDDNGKLISDPDHSEGNIIRIISARKASAKESQTYR